MKEINLLVDDEKYDWFQDNHLKFAPWVRQMMFEYIIKNGGMNEESKEGSKSYGQRDF